MEVMEVFADAIMHWCADAKTRLADDNLSGCLPQPINYFLRLLGVHVINDVDENRTYPDTTAGSCIMVPAIQRDAMKLLMSDPDRLATCDVQLRSNTDGVMFEMGRAATRLVDWNHSCFRHGELY